MLDAPLPQWLSAGLSSDEYSIVSFRARVFRERAFLFGGRGEIRNHPLAVLLFTARCSSGEKRRVFYFGGGAVNACLKAPFPYFGGKRQIADRVWTHLVGIDNYVEPFAGSLAVLLARPSPVTGPETVNDFSCLLINAWRAIQADADGLALLLVSPVAEVNTEAQHWALVSGAGELRNKMGEPDYYDMRLAAYYIKGANEWIGSGWAAEGATGPWSWSPEGGWNKRKRAVNAGTGIKRKLPHLGDVGKGINRKLQPSTSALGGCGEGQYDERIEWATRWLSALRDRICRVRIACGDFARVLTPSVTGKHGITGVFLDPPYDGTEYVYGNSVPISQRVREWCLTAGDDFKVVLAGRGTEHDELLAHGWSKELWTAGRGYSGDLNAERKAEALWIRGTPTSDGQHPLPTMDLGD